MAPDSGNAMGVRDKIENAAAGIAGKAKEVTAKVTGERDRQAEGMVDQAKSHAKKAGESVKDAADDIAGY